MSFTTGHIAPSKGKTTTSDPIRDPMKIQEIKTLLKDNVRDLALWTLALNTALRAGDLVNLTWANTHDDGSKITLTLLEGKTKKRRVIPLNAASSSVVRAWRVECESEFIYSGQRGQMSPENWSRMIKGWCKQVGLEGQFSSHTARKTFCRIQYEQNGVALSTLMHMLNHATETQTLIYLGCLQDDVNAAYANEI